MGGSVATPRAESAELLQACEYGHDLLTRSGSFTLRMLHAVTIDVELTQCRYNDGG